MARGNYFASRCKAALRKIIALRDDKTGAAAENSCPAPLQTGSGRRLLAFKDRPPPGASGRSPLVKAAARLFLRRGHSAAAHESPFFLSGATPGELQRWSHRCASGSAIADRNRVRSDGTSWSRETRAHAVGAETAEIEVEVGMDRDELADIDAGGAFAQAFRRMATGRVVVAGDIETAQRRGQFEGGEVVGREPGDHRQQRQHGFEREHGLDAFAGGEDVGGVAEADAIAEQMAERAARIGERRFGRTVADRARCAGCR